MVFYTWRLKSRSPLLQSFEVVVLGKDGDFVEMVSRYGTPPQLLWVASETPTLQG
jgi:hypothetical protein